MHHIDGNMIMKRTRLAPTLTRTRAPRKINPYSDPDHRMEWGEFAGKKMKKIPAQWFLSLVINGWAFGTLLDWIDENKLELKIRAHEENENGYTQRYTEKHSWSTYKYWEHGTER